MSEAQQPSSHPPRRIAIIGGGLSGLAAAVRILELTSESATPVELTLFEAGSNLGGLVGSEWIGEYLIDRGADSFLTTKPAAVRLCQRLGIEDRLIKTDEKYRGAMVLRQGRPIPVPEGFQLLSPTAIWPVLTSPLFSIGGKLRLMMEWMVPPRSAPIAPDQPAASGSALSDETLANFVRRRFGQEALDRLIQPLVGGIYTSDPEKLSLAATLPRFLEMENEYGSLIRASMFPRRKSGITNDENISVRSKDRSSGARYGQFAGLKGGMNDLVDALCKKIESQCQIRLNTPVVSIQCGHPLNSNSLHQSNSYSIAFDDGHFEQFDGVVVAVTATKTGKLLQQLDADLSRSLGQIEFASTALVISGHQLSDIQNPLHAFGLVVPACEKRQVLAVSFSSRKFPDRAPSGRVLLRTFVGGAMQPELFEKSDQEMSSIVRSELNSMLGVRGEPDFMRIFRYRDAMPQYHVGHLDRVARIESKMSHYPGLELAGIGYRGVGVPDAIATAELAAERVVQTVMDRPRSA